MATRTPTTNDWYAILQVLPTATREEIKTAYRRLALLHHPDRNGGSRSANGKTQLINAAWDVLGDAVKRAFYDRTRPRVRVEETTFADWYRSDAGIRIPTTEREPAQRSSSSRPPPPPPASFPQPSTRRSAKHAHPKAKPSHESAAAYTLWKSAQEKLIAEQTRRQALLEQEISKHAARIAANRQRLRDGCAFTRLDTLTSISENKLLLDDEKTQLERENLDRVAAMRGKRREWDGVVKGLNRLREELRRGVDGERARVEREREREREKSKVFEEARRRSHENQSRFDEQTRKFKEDRRTWSNAWCGVEERRGSSSKQETPSNPPYAHFPRDNAQNARGREETQECLHGWWDQIGGPGDCKACAWEGCEFVYRCPGCKVVFCGSCMESEFFIPRR